MMYEMTFLYHRGIAGVWTATQADASHCKFSNIFRTQLFPIERCCHRNPYMSSYSSCAYGEEAGMLVLLTPDIPLVALLIIVSIDTILVKYSISMERHPILSCKSV